LASSALAFSTAIGPTPSSPATFFSASPGWTHFLLSGSILPSPDVSRTIGHQPEAFLGSWVWSQILVLNQVITEVSPDSHSVLVPSKVKLVWLPPEQSGMFSTFCVLGSNTTSCAAFLLVSGKYFDDGTDPSEQ